MLENHCARPFRWPLHPAILGQLYPCPLVDGVLEASHSLSETQFPDSEVEVILELTL